jgi:hypothetical protein
MDNEPAPRPLSRVDLALLRAVKAFVDPLRPAFWDVFPAERRASLKWGWENAGVGDTAAAAAALRFEHEAQARPDLTRIHPSWWARALKDEPRSVQRTVAFTLPASLRGSLCEELGLSTDDLAPDRPPDPHACALAAALWSARLAGDVPELAGDPPVVAALTRFDSRTVARLLRATGLAKWALTQIAAPPLDAHDSARYEGFKTGRGDMDPRFAQVCMADVEAIGPGATHAVEQAGIVSFARQLNTAEPFRARWALQHVPYSTAQALRAMMGPPGRKAPMLARWESGLLAAAWRGLHCEGRIVDPWEFGP